MKIIVSTCDAYNHLLRPWAHQWNKYTAGLPVTALCETQAPDDLPGNVTPVFVNQRSWSARLMDYLLTIQDNNVLYLLEDYWLNKPVNLDMVYFAHGAMMHGYHKIDLNGDRIGLPHDDFNDWFVRSHTTADYLTSVQAALWRRDFLLAALCRGEDPWTFENQGTQRVKGMTGLTILGTKTPAISYARVVHRDPHTYDLGDLSPEDRNDLMKTLDV